MGHEQNRKARRPPVFNPEPNTLGDYQEGAAYALETAFYVGPSTDRVALSNEGIAKTGDHWQDTDGLKLLRVYRGGGSWTPPVPPRFRAKFRRSDGALLVNNGVTAMRWQSVDENSLGCEYNADASGAYVTVPEPGIYAISGSVPIDFPSPVWLAMDFGAGGGTIIEGAAAETNVQSGFARPVANRVLHIPLTTTRIGISMISNAAGVMRTDGDFTLTRRSDLM